MSGDLTRGEGCGILILMPGSDIRINLKEPTSPDGEACFPGIIPGGVKPALKGLMLRVPPIRRCHIGVYNGTR